MGNRKVLIVGAGIGGLAAGYWLRRRGFEVEILEASDRPGGGESGLRLGRYGVTGEGATSAAGRRMSSQERFSKGGNP